MRVVQNITANAEVFATGDGATSVYPLTFDGLTLVDPEKARVTAIHRADWQGRQLLYPTPRTNRVRQSSTPTSSSLSNVTLATVAGAAPDGSASVSSMTVTGGTAPQMSVLMTSNAPVVDEDGNTGFSLFVDKTSPSGFAGIQVNQQNGPTVLAASFIALNLATGVLGNEFLVSTALNNFTATVDSLPGWYKITIKFPVRPTATSVQPYICVPNSTTSRSGTVGAVLRFFGGMSFYGSYIPTTSAPVTLTDYTYTPAGQVTLGQVPVNGAVLDWGGSGTINLLDATPTFLSQYATSPILTSLIQAANETIDPQADFDAFMANVWDVYTAQGFGLDIWGRIVNIPRTINIPASSDFFGFDEALPDAEPFNQAPFYNGPTGGTLFTLTDDAYRVLILTKALANISSFTAQSMNALLNFMFNGQGSTRGSCYVLESGTPMQISYVFNFALTSWEAAVLEQSSLMPRPTGVGVTITVNP